MSAGVGAVSPEMAYGLALLELHQQNTRDQDLIRDANHEVAKTQHMVGTIYRGLENAEKEIQRDMAYLAVAVWAVTTAISVVTFGQNAAAGNINQASIVNQVKGQLMIDPQPPDVKGLLEKALGYAMQLTNEMSKLNEGLAKQQEAVQVKLSEAIKELSAMIDANRSNERALTKKFIEVGTAIRTIMA